MITAIAIDDEPKAIEVIKHHASKLDDVHLLAHFYNAEDAIAFLKENPIDLVFLDINMPNRSGLELLQELHFKPMVIFTTAYSEFALESYDYDAIDYLLKPITFDRFIQAIEKLKKRMQNKKSAQKYCFIKDGGKTIKLVFDDILFIKGAGNYLDIITKNKTHTVRMTFNEIISKINTSQFARVHQSYIVNINNIEKIETNHIFIQEHKIVISSKYKEMFFKLIT